jgi:hypothetical protein
VVAKQILREEAPEEIRASYRQIYEGEGRKLVVKQFLYDWAPPAYDYPSLWRDAKRATTAEAPPPRAFFIGNHALWIGKNYRMQNGATLEKDRTRVEITLENGNFTDNELIYFCHGLEPANPEKAETILRTPFSHLSYQKRHLEKASGVPTGFWKHQRDKSLFSFALDKTAFEPPELIKEKLEELGYFLNSIFAVGENAQHPVELEFIFEHKDSPGSFIRLLTPTKFPPEVGDQECLCNGLYATSKTFSNGPHEAVFQQNGQNHLILVKPAPWTTQTWFFKLFKSLTDSKG